MLIAFWASDGDSKTFIESALGGTRNPFTYGTDLFQKAATAVCVFQISCIQISTFYINYEDNTSCLFEHRRTGGAEVCLNRLLLA